LRFDALPSLHELAATLESGNVLAVQVEPLTVPAPIRKTLMPVPLNTHRIVGLYRMYKLKPFWQLELDVI
jgi:hypothetical protein